MSKKLSKKDKKEREQLCELYAEAICDFKEYFRDKKKFLAAKKKKTKKNPQTDE